MTRRRLLGLAQAGYLLGLVGFAAFLLADRRSGFDALVEGARPAYLVGSFLLLCAQAWLGAVVWHETLSVFGESVPLRSLWRAVGQTLPTRYVPGGIWMVVSRSAILRGRGIALAVISAAALLEQALVTVLGLIVGVIALVATGDGPVRVPVLIVVACVGALACTPSAINAVQRLVARGAPTPVVRGADYGRLLGAVGVYTLWSALSFVTYLQAFPAVDAAVVRQGGAYLVAWVLGFVAVFAPQGAGVSETATAAMLTAGPIATLALLIGGFRLVVLVRDVAVALATVVQRDE